MRRPLTTIVLAIAALAPCAWAQAPAAPPTATSGNPSADLKKQYDDLVKYLAKRGSIGPDERRQVEAMVAKVKAAPFFGDALTSAMMVQLGSYLGDWASVDAAYERILSLQPHNDTALSQWIGVRRDRGQVTAALDSAASMAPDLAAMPRTGLAVAETLIATNRFDEASALLADLAAVCMARPDLAGTFKSAQVRVAPLTGLWKLEQSLRGMDEQKNDLPRIELITTKGVLVLELFEDQAPATTAAILGLVEEGAYNGTSFRKRLPGLALLAGDPNTRVGATGRPGFGSPGWRVPDESSRSDRRVGFRGSFGLAKALDPAKPGSAVANSAGQDLFFLLAPGEFLADQFTTAGRILDGLDLLESLGPGDEIVAARVLRKRDHAYEAVRMPELPMPMELTVVAAPLGKNSSRDISKSGSSAPLAKPPQGPVGAPAGQPRRGSSPPVVPPGTPIDPENSPVSPRPPSAPKAN